MKEAKKEWKFSDSDESFDEMVENPVANPVEKPT